MIYPEFQTLSDRSDLSRWLCVLRSVRNLSWSVKAIRRSRKLPDTHSRFNMTSEPPLYIVSAHGECTRTSQTLSIGMISSNWCVIEPKPHRILPCCIKNLWRFTLSAPRSMPKSSSLFLKSPETPNLLLFEVYLEPKICLAMMRRRILDIQYVAGRPAPKVYCP